MQEVLTNDTYIKSPKTRREFRRHIIQRFDEEGALVALIGYGHESMIAEEIHDDAARLVQTSGEDEIFARVGDALPKEVVSFLQQVDELARNVMPPGEMRYLPPPRHLIERGALGRTVVGSVRSVAWRALCDPNSDIYQMWVREGIGAVVNSKYLAAALTASIAGLGIGLKALVVSMLALVMKFGIEVFCDRFSPQPVMQIRRRR